MDEFQFLLNMYRRLEDMQRCYSSKDGGISAAEAAIRQSIIDYQEMRRNEASLNAKQ